MNVNLTNDSPAMVSKAYAPRARVESPPMFRTAPLALLAALIAAAAFTGTAEAGAPCAPTHGVATAAVNQKHAATLLFIPGPVRTPEPVLAADLQQLPGF